MIYRKFAPNCYCRSSAQTIQSAGISLCSNLKIICKKNQCLPTYQQHCCTDFVSHIPRTGCVVCLYTDSWSKYCQAHPFIPQPHIWMWTLKKAKWNVSQTYEISSTDPSGKEPIDMFEKWKPLGQKGFKGNWTDLLLVRFQTCQSDFRSQLETAQGVGCVSVLLCPFFVFSLLWPPPLWVSGFWQCVWQRAWLAPPTEAHYLMNQSIQTCSSLQCKTVPPCFSAPTSDQWLFFFSWVNSVCGQPATIIYIYWLVLFCACIFLDETSILTL